MKISAPLEKDPEAKLDYGFNWSPWLYPGDVIAESTWAISGVDTALTQSAPWRDDRETGVWLAAGTVGATYRVTNHIKTTQGREDDRTFKLTVVQK